MESVREIFRRCGVRGLYCVLAALQAGSVFLHRSFPTQDGPVQLYYADVLADLLRGGGTYAAYFRTNSHSPVYAFCNYALVLLNQLFSPLTSERILVSAYAMAFALGAWFLIRSVNRENDWLPFFLLPFAFHAYLYLGIYNYTFGIAALLFAMGLWLRSTPGWTRGAVLRWMAIVALLCTLHPLMLAFLSLFVCGHISAVFVRTGFSWRRIATGAAAALPLAAACLWVASFRSTGTGAPADSAHASVSDRLHCLVQMVALSPFFDPLYRFGLLLLVLVPLSLLVLRAARGSWKLRPESGSAAFALGLTAAVGLALFIFAPPWYFGAGFFADRMSVVVVVCGLAAMAPLTLPLPLRRAAVVTAVCVLPLLSVIRDGRTAKLVAGLTPAYDARPLSRGGWGAIVSGTEGVPGLIFNPYYWAGAHYARASKAVLLNTPWLYGSLAVLTPREVHPWDGASPESMGLLLGAGREGAAPKLQFVCGGTPASGLSRELGMTTVFESETSYCAGRGGSVSSLGSDGGMVHSGK